ncbi:unnamed protein product, partial [Prorocentrum cordatum]
PSRRGRAAQAPRGAGPSGTMAPGPEGLPPIGETSLPPGVTQEAWEKSFKASLQGQAVAFPDTQAAPGPRARPAGLAATATAEAEAPAAAGEEPAAAPGQPSAGGGTAKAAAETAAPLPALSGPPLQRRQQLAPLAGSRPVAPTGGLGAAPGLPPS